MKKCVDKVPIRKMILLSINLNDDRGRKKFLFFFFNVNLYSITTIVRKIKLEVNVRPQTNIRFK